MPHGSEFARIGLVDDDDQLDDEQVSLSIFLSQYITIYTLL